VKGGNWKTISSERHFADRNLEVVTDRVQTPAHPNPRAWTIVHRKPAVVVAPMTQEGKIILIRQERIPIGQAIWEMPSGQIDNHNSDPENIKDVALRELREETGYELASNGELVSLGYYFSSPGFRSMVATRSPSARKRCATAAPIPDPPPVTTAFFTHSPQPSRMNLPIMRTVLSHGAPSQGMRGRLFALVRRSTIDCRTVRCR